jgi:hypothetical protein
MGLVFSLPFAFSGLEVPEHLGYSKMMMFVATVVLGMIYGFLIEGITSGVFKARYSTR